MSAPCPPLSLTLIKSTDSLDVGRQASNTNDELLAAQLCMTFMPAHEHVQVAPATTWTINHGLGSAYILPTVEDASGFFIEPQDIQKVTDNQLVLTFAVAAAGKCYVYLGKANYVTPSDSVVGTPTDGDWTDGPAGIVAGDMIKDALDKLNETLARIAPPPEALSGSLIVQFPGGYSFVTARIPTGTGQNLSTIAAGSQFANVTITDALQLKTPTSPANQFGKADKGTLKYFQLTSNEVDSVDLETPFVELEREGEQTWPAGASFTVLWVDSVGMHSNIPAYQRGQFTVFTQSELAAGEVYGQFVRHSVGVTDYDSDVLVTFYDDGPIPTVVGTPELLELALTSSKHLDGIQYYSTNDTFSVVARIANGFKRTYAEQPVELALSGAATTLLAHNNALLSPTKAGSQLDDDFTGAVIDAVKWTAVGSPVQDEVIEFTNDTPTATVTKSLTSNGSLIRKSLFQLDVAMTLLALASDGGWRAGVELTGPTGGKLEFLYHEADDGVTNQVEVWFTPNGGARTSHADEALTLAEDDVLHFRILNTAADTYRFSYAVNAGAFAQIGTDLAFTSWGPKNAHKMKATLLGSNAADTNLPSFSVFFDDFAITSGRSTSLAAVPDIDDSMEVLAYTLTINQASQATNNARLSVLPKSVRGTSLAVQSASENRLLNTYGNVATDTVERFFDNNYRLPSGAWDVPPVGATGNWTDTDVLTNGSAQVFNGKLAYPDTDFETGYLPVQQASTDYSGFTGSQTYFRCFVPASPKSNGTLRMTGVSLANLTSNAILVDVKIPGITAWLSLNEVYDESLYTGIVDGQGIRTSSTSSDFSFTFGELSTGAVAKVVVRITLPADSAPEPTYLEMLGWSS